MIIYIRIFKDKTNNDLYDKSSQIFYKFISKEYNSLNINKNITFIKNIIKDTVISYPVESVGCDVDLIIFSKLLEFYFLEQYNKDLNDIKLSQETFNVSDYIIKNLFLFEEIYDFTIEKYKSYKEKIYWNFGEICQMIYINYPKMFKKTILRHLLNRPNNQSLTYNLIQYYNSNKDYRKTKILYRVK
jgi:hypothetical protein